MVVRHRSLPKLEKTLSTKRMILDKDPQPSEEMTEKKSKVQKIRERESLTKRHSIANIIADTRSSSTQKIKDLNSSIILQQHFTQKLGITDPIEAAGLAFPRLSSHLRKKRVSKKDISKDEAA